MVKVKRTRALPFPLKYYTRVGQSIRDCDLRCIVKYGICVDSCMGVRDTIRLESPDIVIKFR